MVFLIDIDLVTWRCQSECVLRNSKLFFMQRFSHKNYSWSSILRKYLRDASSHCAKIGGHLNIQMCHFVIFWAREMLFTSKWGRIWWGIEWNNFLWPMDEILTLWPRFSFDSNMILEFKAMSMCWPNVQRSLPPRTHLKLSWYFFICLHMVPSLNILIE